MKILNCTVQTLKLTFLAAGFGAVLAAPAHAQIAPRVGFSSSSRPVCITFLAVMGFNQAEHFTI